MLSFVLAGHVNKNLPRRQRCRDVNVVVTLCSYSLDQWGGGSMNEFAANIEMSDQQMNECDAARVTT